LTAPAQTPLRRLQVRGTPGDEGSSVRACTFPHAAQSCRRIRFFWL